MSRSKTVTTRIGRDAGTEQFIPVRQAQRDRQGAVVETIKRLAPTPSPSKRK